MSMYTVKQWLDIGVSEFYGGDIFENTLGEIITGTLTVNAGYGEGLFVKEFTKRKNAGSQPVPDGVMVDVEFGGYWYEGVSAYDAGSLNWKNKLLTQWKPSLVQPLIDSIKNKASEIIEQSAIHKAWVDLKGDLSNAEKHDSGGKFLVVCIKDGISINKGEYQIAHHKTNNTEYWENVCTIPEFTSYCEKMAAEEKRMNIIGQNGNDGLHYDYTAQQVEALAINNPSERAKAALKEADEIQAKLSNDKPIFTQAMADAGELPPVGCSVMYKPDYSTAGTESGKWYFAEKVIAYYGGHVWLSDNGIRPVKSLSFKPVKNDREKAIDAALALDEYRDGLGMMSRKDFVGKLYDNGLLKC